MAFIDGDDPINGSLFSFQEWERMKNNWRGAVVPTNAQPGMLFSDSDDDELYMMGPALQRIIKENAAGRVGIGTINPSQVLTIETGGGTGGLSLLLAGVSKMLFGIIGAPENWIVGSSTDDIAIRGKNNIIFSTDDGTTLCFYIKHNGNIGIGTILPTEKLEVAGNFKITAGKINIICLDNNIICIDNDVVLG
jgi:hypothetical protein